MFAPPSVRPPVPWELLTHRRQPFEFSVDPADLLDEEAPVEEPDNGN